MEHSVNDSGPLTDSEKSPAIDFDQEAQPSRRIDRLYLAFAGVTIVIWLLLLWVLF